MKVPSTGRRFGRKVKLAGKGTFLTQHWKLVCGYCVSREDLFVVLSVAVKTDSVTDAYLLYINYYIIYNY